MLGRRWPTRRSQCRAHHAERKFLMSVSTRKHTAPAGGKVPAVAEASLFAATALAGSALAQAVKIGLVGGISGPIAALTPPMIQTSNLAVDDVTAKGGMLGGKKLVAVVGASACSLQGATDAETRKRVREGNSESTVG